MKKLLLTLVALICVMVGKANIVESFAQGTTWSPSFPELPEKGGADLSGVFTSEASGIEYTFADCKYYGDYVMANKNAGTISFALPEGTSAFIVKTGAQASTAVTVSVTVGSTAVATDKKLDKQDADFTFEIPANLQNSKEICTIKVTNNKNAQFQSFTYVTEGGGETPVDPDPIVPDDPVDSKVTSIKALLDVAKGLANREKTDEFELDFPMTVTYAHGINTYVTDGTDNLLIYGDLGIEGLENGKVIPEGLKGKMTVYNGLPELTDVVAESIGALTDGTPVEPAEATVANVTEKGISAYVKLEGVTISGLDTKGNFSISEGANTVAGYNTFHISIPESENLTIVGIVSYFNKYQISPISITGADGKETVAAPTFNPAAGEVEAGTTVTIATTTEGASIYYTLDGTAPTSASTLYEAPVEIKEALTIKAIALKDGFNDSEVAEAAYTIKVPADATFNFTKPETLDPKYPADFDSEGLAADGSNKSAIVSDIKFTDKHVSVVSTKGTSTDAKIYYRTSDTQLRVYNGATMTFTTDEPTIHLAKIVFGFTSNTNVDKIEVEKGEGTWTPANHTWTGDLRQLTFKIGGNIQINTIEVYTVEGDPIELPEPELPEATKVASIKALLDANTAVESGNTTEGEFTLDFPVTVIYSEGQYNYVTDGTNNLLIYSNLGKSGLENGIVLPAGITGKYKNQNGLPELVSVAAASVGDPTDGTEVEPVATTVEDANAEGLSAYIVLEGVTVSGVNGKNFTIADEAGNTIAGYNSLGISVPEGTDLTVTGFVSIYNTTYQIAPVSITNAQGKETVATPTFNPEGGEVLAGTRVNIYTSTEGASIYYTVDGSEPTAASTLYETAVEITEAVTIKAIAVKEGCDDSEVAEATYTLKAPADATFNFASPASLSPAYPADKDDSTLEADGTNGFYANVTDVKFTDGDITVTSTKGSTDARLYYQNNGKVQLRVYNGGTTTISSDNAKLLIAKIVITYNNGSTSYNKVVAPAEGNWDKETGTWTPAEGVAGAKSVTFEYTGTQQINAIEVYTAEASGVDSIGVDGDNAPAVYYNLQGVRVDNPTPGLYIMRQGSKAIKVLVR